MGPAEPSRYATLSVATCNLLNLANPGRVYYPHQDPYSQHEFEHKIDWLGERFATLNADILAVQEVWDEAAFKGAVKRSRLHYHLVAAPGAENSPGQHGAEGTPRLGLATRLAVDELRSLHDFALPQPLEIPGLGVHRHFERPPLLATLRMKHGQGIRLLNVHLKSKRPKFLLDELGHPLEDRDDPKVAALATLRSLMMRGAEAAALRGLVVDLLNAGPAPLIVVGDFNDGPHSVTTQLVAATSEVAYDRSARRLALFNAYDEQSEMGLRSNVAYSHIHQGHPEVLDQILVSEGFLAEGRFSIGDVRRIQYFTDHLNEGHNRSRSDHGFVRALLRLRLPLQD
ncbi:MAG: endonuclease [Curvibacter sp.]|nr:endonuclease [Curvibacter sp.]